MTDASISGAPEPDAGVTAEGQATGPVPHGIPPTEGALTSEEAAGAAASEHAPAGPPRTGHPSPAESALDADVDPGDPSGDDVVAAAEAAVVSDLALIEKERDEFRALAQRIQADFENFKKQTSRRQADMVERAGEDLVGKLLPVLDTADLAVSHDDNEALLQLASSLYDVLAKEGLERIDPVGAAFDPTEHDAVMHEPGDGGEPQVLEVLRAGYRWKGRLVRPAMVKVKG